MMTRLGRSDLDIAPICLGGNVFGWTADRETSFAILDAFAEGGGDFIDTADQYSAWVDGNPGGVSESTIGAWLADRRPERIVVATKVGKHPEALGLAPHNVRAACEGSLRRLGLETIDLYYAHEDDPSVPLDESVQAFADLQAEGKIRHVALSNFEADRLHAWLETADGLGVPRPVAVQPHYNLIERDAEAALLPAAVEQGLAVVPYYALASGFLTGKYRTAEDLRHGARGPRAAAYAGDTAWRVVAALLDVAAARAAAPATIALAWLQAQPGVAAPIASASRPEQLAALLAARDVQLSADELAMLSAPNAE
jgi:aryl-alcohol dehydrogenase-like predicted oxidoreductase